MAAGEDGVHPSYNAALQAIQQARGAGSSRDAAVSLQEARQYNLIGDQASKFQMLERLRKEREQAESQYLELARGRTDAELAKAKAHVLASRNEAGYPDLEAMEAIRAMPGSPRYKADLMVQTRLNTMKNVAFDQNALETMRDHEFGILTAREAGDRLPSAFEAVTILKNPNASPRDLGKAQAAMTGLQAMLHDRYGDVANPEERRLKMSGELRGVYVDKFTEMHIARGMPVEKAEQAAITDADQWLAFNIRGVEKYNEQGRRPGPSIPVPSRRPPPQETPAPAAEPAKKMSFGREEYMGPSM
jgi:hypothetical protein